MPDQLNIGGVPKVETPKTELTFQKDAQGKVMSYDQIGQAIAQNTSLEEGTVGSELQKILKEFKRLQNTTLSSLYTAEESNRVVAINKAAIGRCVRQIHNLVSQIVAQAPSQDQFNMYSNAEDLADRLINPKAVKTNQPTKLDPWKL